MPLDSSSAPPQAPSLFYDPTIDWGFKRLFGSIDSKVILRGFLNDLLYAGRQTIAKLEIVDPYLPGVSKLGKNTVVDVRARLSTGESVLIEMQMFPVTAFAKRVLFNACKEAAHQLSRGADYTELQPVTVISVANCHILPGSEWLRSYELREQRSGELHPGGNLRLVYLELPKANLEDAASVAADHPAREWVNLLKNANKWSKMPKDIANKNVRKAMRMARQDNLNSQELEAMSRRQLAIHDRKNAFDFARKEGVALGITEGVAQGVAQGVARIVLAMRAKGLSDKEIASLTDFSLAEIEAIPGGPAKPAKAKTTAKAKTKAKARKAALQEA